MDQKLFVHALLETGIWKGILETGNRNLDLKSVFVPEMGIIKKIYFLEKANRDRFYW